MKYTVEINEKSKSITVDLDGYKGTAKCCPTDSFNITTGIELALERAKVAKANAEKPKVVAKPMGVMELVKALEKALPKGQMVIVGNGNYMTEEQKKWLCRLADCGCSCHKSKSKSDGEYYTDEEIEDIKDNAYDEGYNEGYADGEESVDDRYDEGYDDGHSDGYDSGYSDAVDEYENECDYADEMRDKIKAILDEYDE